VGDKTWAGFAFSLRVDSNINQILQNLLRGRTFVVNVFCTTGESVAFFTKIQSLQLAREIALIQSLPKIRDLRWGSEQRAIYKLAALMCLKAVLWTRAIKLTQNCVCFGNPCTNLLVSSFVTREYHPKVVEFLHLLHCRILTPYTDSAFWRDNGDFHSYLVARSRKRIKCMLETLLRRCKQYQIVLKKQTVDRATSNSDISFTWLLLPIQLMWTMERSGDSTHLWLGQQPAEIFEGCGKMIVTCNKLALSNFGGHLPGFLPRVADLPLSESNTHCKRLWYNSADTDTNFWAGIEWLDGQ